MPRETWQDHYDGFRSRVSHVADNAETMNRIIETLSAGKEFTVRVTDHTLMPFIEPGDLMVFNQTNFEKMKLGDFVLYRLNNGMPAVRRVIRKTLVEGHAVIITRSDTNHDEKDQVKASQVIGRLTCIERHGKRIRGDRLNRGIVDWMTQFGTRHPLARLGDLFLLLLPISKRPGYKPIENVNRIDAPALNPNSKKKRKKS